MTYTLYALTTRSTSDPLFATEQLVADFHCDSFSQLRAEARDWIHRAPPSQPIRVVLAVDRSGFIIAFNMGDHQ